MADFFSTDRPANYLRINPVHPLVTCAPPAPLVHPHDVDARPEKPGNVSARTGGDPVTFAVFHCRRTAEYVTGCPGGHTQQ